MEREGGRKRSISFTLYTMSIPFPNLCLEEKLCVVVGSCGCVCVCVLKMRTGEGDKVF